MQASYAMELQRTADAIRRKTANQLREAKMRAKESRESGQEQPISISTQFQGGDLNSIVTPPPPAFISYSWDSEIHSAWVRALATRLRADGINVSIDQWSAIPGDQLPAFMEREIRENRFVIIVCTPRYKSRSEARQGGVGYEGDIMTAEVMGSGNHRKFIPILRSGSWAEAAPSWLSGKYHIALAGDPYPERGYEDLVRTLLGIRLEAPPIGKPFSTVSRGSQHAVEANPNSSNGFEDIQITRVIVEDVTEPRNDGTRGSALYSIPFALSRRPSSEWEELFIENWNHPPKWTSKHRPGILSLRGATVTLNGTTIEEVEKCHRDTLQLAVSESNRQYREWLAAQRSREAKEKSLREDHQSRVSQAGSRIKFD
jgi:hypothetical protein